MAWHVRHCRPFDRRLLLFSRDLAFVKGTAALLPHNMDAFLYLQFASSPSWLWFQHFLPPFLRVSLLLQVQLTSSLDVGSLGKVDFVVAVLTPHLPRRMELLCWIPNFLVDLSVLCCDLCCVPLPLLIS